MERSTVQRMRDVAVIVAMPDLGDLQEAVLLAEELVAAGPTGGATVDVAALPRNVTRRDGEATVRAMLAEYDITVPDASDDRGRYELLLYAFGVLGLPYAMFETAFYGRLTRYDLQSELDRTVAQMMVNDMDAATDPRERATIEERIRDAVRSHLGA